ncbi:hypothetical protein J3459_015252 [Metarhizium acridum]|uniref:uncharacterized protein n=1 Tax=Metarhizium acridum TaxID=92637 RepID=UPI001C6BCEF9|nr:hypothetical protein J3459_015252 [Metarhizium acridum]KAG8414117.1 hypothetical protein J3458_011767 [Metarhizium acridum]
MVHLAEAAAGCKFDVSHLSLSRLQDGYTPELPSGVQIHPFVPKEMVMRIRQGAGLAMATGWMNLDAKNDTLNGRLPDITTLTVAELFSKYIPREDSAHYG